MTDTTLDDTLVGQLLERRYQVTSRLAQGGMATVYLALDTRLDRTVALKVMHAELARHDEFVARFIGEARSAARISHPNVVAVYDQGRDGARVYLTMEYIAGGTLRDELAHVGRLTPRQMWRTMRPVLSALGAAHRIGMVHRDVKPENVLIAKDDGGFTVKVADFGLARTVAAEPERRAGRDAASLGGVLVGTASYLAPEQVARGVSDTRSDVYSAGVVMYELLTGRKPFTGDDPMEVAQRHVHADVPPPSALVPGLDPALDALVAHATDRDPAGRPSDADALLAALDRACGTLPDSALDLGLAGPDTTVKSRALADSGTRTRVMTAAGAARTTAFGTAGTGRERTLLGDIAQPTAVLDPRDRGRGRPAGGPRRPRGWRRRRGLLWFALIVALAAVTGATAWWIGSGRFTSVPSVLTLDRQAATQRLAHAGLHVRLGPGVYSQVDAAGEVVTSAPGPGGRVDRGGTVTLRLSLGPAQRDVPDVLGDSTAALRTALSRAGLTLGTLTRAYDQHVASGDVVSTSPTAGTPLKPGSRVAVVLSRGPRPVAVPDVVGMPQAAAATRLIDAGFSVKAAPARVYADSVPVGEVVSQSVTGTAAPHTTITLTVSRGPHRYRVPDVSGMTTGDAKTALRQAGFTHIRVVAVPLIDSTVVSQSPEGGSSAPHSQTITLYAY